MTEKTVAGGRESLSGGQQAVAMVWLFGWSWVVLWWWSANQGGGWLEDLVTPTAVIAWLVGAGFVGLVAGIARYLLSSPAARYGVLIGLPGLAVIWLLIAIG